MLIKFNNNLLYIRLIHLDKDPTDALDFFISDDELSLSIIKTKNNKLSHFYLFYNYKKHHIHLLINKYSNYAWSSRLPRKRFIRLKNTDRKIFKNMNNIYKKIKLNVNKIQ